MRGHHFTKKKAGIVTNKETTTKSDHIKQVINENIEKQSCQNWSLWHPR